VGKTERFGNGARSTRLSRGRWPVDGDDSAAHLSLNRPRCWCIARSPLPKRPLEAAAFYPQREGL